MDDAVLLVLVYHVKMITPNPEVDVINLREGTKSYSGF